MDLNRYCHNHGLFADAYFEKVLQSETYPRTRHLPDADSRLEVIQSHWNTHRGSFMRRPAVPEGKLPPKYVGLPVGYVPLDTQESEVENKWIAYIVDRCFGLAYHQNRTMDMTGEIKRKGQRPDLILFRNQQVLEATVQACGSKKGAFSDGAAFCRDALMIIDAKKFGKGVHADEGVDATQPKQLRGQGGLRADIKQVADYLSGYVKSWGVLSNGRSWRLMNKGELDKHLRFDLVLLLEDLNDKRISPEEGAEAFRLFWYLFGPPAVDGGYLDDLLRESEAATRQVRETLEENVHEALRLIAEGFRKSLYNRNDLPEFPDQTQLDHLREVSLVLLYRLLFILKAEALDLLELTTDSGAPTEYRRMLSTPALFEKLGKISPNDRRQYGNVYEEFRRLCGAISSGDPVLDIPAYNGGLFDDVRHPDLAKWRMVDESFYEVLSKLAYLGGSGSQPIPYKDLDVRDLGDIYEGLLEKRLVAAWDADPATTILRGQKEEKKASGSYFTPDRLVQHLVSKTLLPVLEQCGDDARRILALRVVDPAMGSGHFLVKAVDVLADWLTVHCDPLDEGAPAENGPEELAYWKAKVVEHCIYGVDFNPMAVELAKVALWLYTARKDKPLSFLDHHLKCGNSLVGATVSRLVEPGLKCITRKSGPTWVAVPAQDTLGTSTSVTSRKKRRKADSSAQQMLPFDLDTSMLSGIVSSIRGILDRPSDRPEDVKAKSKDYADAVLRKLAAHRLLADLWCAQWFIADPANDDDVRTYASPEGLYAKVKQICGVANDTNRAEAIWNLGGMQEQPPTQATPRFLRRLKEARSEGYGPRPLTFFHWQLEFPEVAFDAQGQPKQGFGFDVVLGNPPWDKIKPTKRDFYTPFSSEVANAQGASLNALITRLEDAQPELIPAWNTYEHGIKSFVRFLAETGSYPHQKAKVGGKTTGGDPDLFRYFVERATHCLGAQGRLGLVVPCTLWQAEGCTGLRRLLLNDLTLESLYTFENYRKWAFAIDSRFKFCALVARAEEPPPGHAFPAAFMLRDTITLDGHLPERVITMDRNMIEALSPETLALLDFRCDADAQLMARIHSEYPRLGDREASSWDVKYRCELHMTNDAWLFKSREWMASRGFAQVLPIRSTDGAWTQQITEHDYRLSLEQREALPCGGEYWVAADEGFYIDCGYQSSTVDLPGGTTKCFIHRDDRDEANKPGSRAEEKHFRIIPGGIYTTLYEGRMVHNFDHVQKAYVSGEGRKAIWRELAFCDKVLLPRTFQNPMEKADNIAECRVGFCDVMGATNERSFLGALLPPTARAGHKVPTFAVPSIPNAVGYCSVLNSFLADSVLRMRVSTSMTLNYVSILPVPCLAKCDKGMREQLVINNLRLCCTTPELADYWNAVFPSQPWAYESAERDPWKRAELRAEIDAIVAELYGLSIAEYARILTGFPLLDRDQPELPGDFFATECDEERAKKLKTKVEGQDWDENDGGVWALKPRSFITRDFALLTYIRRRMEAGDSDAYVPQNLESWYQDTVGLDPAGPLSRFRIGEVKFLSERVQQARELGAVPYVPTGSAIDNPTPENEADCS
jgi:hypothetical protein